MGFGIRKDIGSGHREVDLFMKHFSLPCSLRIPPARAPGARSIGAVTLREKHDGWFFQMFGQETYMISSDIHHVWTEILLNNLGFAGDLKFGCPGFVRINFPRKQQQPILSTSFGAIADCGLGPQ
jgi:hypothetical protein